MNDAISAEEVLNKLTQLGFFKFAQAGDMNRICENIKQNFMQYGGLESGDAYHDFLIPLDRRMYHADAEELAEQGVCDFLNDMRPVLEAEGVQIESLRDDARWTEQKDYIYCVWVNGQQHLICDTSQGEKDCWCLAHKRTLEIIDGLLIAANSRERVYGQASRNDAGIALLTDELHRYICSLYPNDSAVLFRAETMRCE